MSIYRVIYLSDDCRVSGYLGLPPWIHTDSASLLRAGVLDATCIACSLHADTHRPRPRSDPPLPVLVYCRGGIGRVGMVRLDWVSEFASHGFVVFAPSYRGADGGEGRDEFGGQDVRDVSAGIDWLRELPFVDRARVAALGFSRGSINATRAVIENDLAALILWGGVADLAATYEERVDLRRMLRRVVGGTPRKNVEGYIARSPVHAARELFCPVLIVHGTADQQVDVRHGLAMRDALQPLGRRVETHLYDGLGHHFPRPIHEAAVERMLGWAKDGMASP